MADKAKQDMIDNFIKITAVDQDRARFYLESSAWNLELAMGSFYEGDPDDDDDLVGGVVGSAMPQQPPAMAPQEPETGSRKSKTTGTSSSRFATIGSMQGQGEDSSEEEGQAFYAGGSERSGQQVLGPKKKKTNVVEDLFKSAREHGAEEVNSAEPPRPGGSRAFKGSGYRLGDGEGQDSEEISGEPVAKSRRQVDCVLKLWKNGFSVDDGPLRDFKDPANKEFLASISKGEVPHELIQEARGGEVNLNMEDHRTEDYVKPKVPTKAFTGEGNVLGSPAPTVVSASSKSSSKAPSSNQSTLKVDESKPVTTIQIRLADGSRLVSKFNHSHTVRDIRQHITSSRPQYEGANFILQTTFPNRELTNTSETIEQAKLQNAVVVQRLT
ncbi:NSFL1 cofactor p47-like [Ruditapes philippinarum]|uniref:NSFL1 cofactor p47-like n=1 Tax=Ruditapes philippinarum TaxID=129788 RepID=UPI00295B2F92|nr:NSFL1 cofactor p47-like [Ruditapes philippinarum]